MIYLSYFKDAILNKRYLIQISMLICVCWYFFCCGSNFLMQKFRCKICLNGLVRIFLCRCSGRADHTVKSMCF
jgi:hypothetical protein